MNNEANNSMYQNALNIIERDKKYENNYSCIIHPATPSKKNGLASFGGRFSDAHQIIRIVIGSDSQVPLPSTMPNLNTTYKDNTIIVEEAGIYEINYFVNASVELATFLTLAVRSNGVNIPSTVISRLVDVDTGNFYSGSTIVSLPAKAEIDMVMSALIAVGITLGTGLNATLTVKKLN